MSSGSVKYVKSKPFSATTRKSEKPTENPDRRFRVAIHTGSIAQRHVLIWCTDSHCQHRHSLADNTSSRSRVSKHWGCKHSRRHCLGPHQGPSSVFRRLTEASSNFTPAKQLNFFEQELDRPAWKSATSIRKSWLSTASNFSKCNPTRWSAINKDFFPKQSTPQSCNLPRTGLEKILGNAPASESTFD